MAVRKEDTPAGQAAGKVQPDPAPAPPASPDPAAADATADRVAELERENADLRRQVERLATGAAGTVRLETSDRPDDRPRRLVISEGVRDDLERYGEVTDPGTGYVLRRDDETGEVTVIDRATGEPARGVVLAERRG